MYAYVCLSYVNLDACDLKTHILQYFTILIQCLFFIVFNENFVPNWNTVCNAVSKKHHF